MGVEVRRCCRIQSKDVGKVRLPQCRPRQSESMCHYACDPACRQGAATLPQAVAQISLNEGNGSQAAAPSRRRMPALLKRTQTRKRTRRCQSHRPSACGRRSARARFEAGAAHAADITWHSDVLLSTGPASCRLYGHQVILVVLRARSLNSSSLFWQCLEDSSGPTADQSLCNDDMQHKATV